MVIGAPPSALSATDPTVLDVARRWGREVMQVQRDPVPVRILYVGFKVWLRATSGGTVLKVTPLFKKHRMKDEFLETGPSASLARAHFKRWDEDLTEAQKSEIQKHLRRPCPKPAEPLGAIGQAKTARTMILVLKASRHLKALSDMSLS